MQLSSALAAATRDWVRGRVHLELGTLASRNRERTRALAAYREAERLCHQDQDDSCVDAARASIRKDGRL
jgi:hypothetical protein